MLFPQARSSCVFFSSVNGFGAISQTDSTRKQGLLGVLLACSHLVSQLPATSPKYKSQKEEIRENFDSFSVNW